MRVPVFTGACPALVTPFHESGGIDFDAFARLIDYQISAGVEAVCVCGTTGESAVLSTKERVELIKFCVDHVNGRVKVIAGTGSNNTKTAAENSIYAHQAGADALLIVTPYYNKATQAGLIRHYETIAAQTSLPIILYNVPSRTGVSFTAETYAELAKIPTVNGTKEASGDLSLFIHTKKLCPDDFHVWSGNDDQTVPMMALGAKGVISVAANIIPDIMVQICRFCLRGDFFDAAQLQLEYTTILDALFIEVNPIPIKSAMELLGMCSSQTRLPLCPPTPQHLTEIKNALLQSGLLT